MSTPETDAAEFPCMTWPSQEHPMVVKADYARKLERERDEARGQRDEWKSKFIQQNKVLGYELRDPNGTIWSECKRLQSELTAATEQRDELAESLDFQFKLNRECIDQITTRTKERDEARKDSIFWQSLADPRFARFGESMWKYITKQGSDFCWSKDSEDILPLAEAAGLCCRVEYNPAIHGNVIESDLGDEIWWWGDFDWMNNQPT